MSSTTAPRTAPRKSMLVVAVAVAITLLAGCITHEQQVVLNNLNRDRQAHGRGALPTHGQAQAKAQAWAEKLAREGRLYHSNLSSGITARWCGLAENVGFGSNAGEVQRAYMNSSGHRANILNNSWNGVGTGYAKANGRVYTVQVFIRTC